MTKLLSGDNAYNRIMGRLFDLTLISVLTVLCCITALFSGQVIAEEEGKVIDLQQEAEEKIVEGFLS